MRVFAEMYARYDYWRPAGTRWLEHGVRALDRLFDRAYSSRYNPLYRTGTLASLCLAIALATGVYLLFVYDIARPHESMERIQGDLLLGRPIRALHRYASDLAVVAVILHVLRLAVQGKTWGPRALAWITGVLLVGMMFLSAMTGFVLVWDELGQKLAVVGARALRLLPLFPEPPDRAFVGERPVASQFFFMNLFLHVAVPLGMVCFLWLHTARLARAAWFPERKVTWGTLIGLTVLSVAWPAPLPPAADLLTIPGRVETDWFYAFWLPLAHASPAAGLAVTALVTALLLAVPWLVRPRARSVVAPPAFADPDRCEGCEQCFKDCPYDAIRMVTGKYPDKHPLRAEVQPDLCVSCGLCAGSCASLAIGPDSRTARHQLASARELVAGTGQTEDKTLVVACRNNGGVAERVASHFVGDPSVACFEVDCAGTLHPGTVSYLGGQFGGTVILGCPPQNCVHREGAMLADARILMERKPAVPGRIARQSVRVLHGGMGEWPDLRRVIDTFRRSASAPSVSSLTRARTLAAVGFTAVLLVALALGSRWPQGTDTDQALLRLGWRLAGQVKEQCRELTPDELAKKPAHMRTPRECVSQVLAYDLKALVDGRVVADKRVRPAGLRADRPLSVEEDLAIAPGEHTVQVTFTPEDPGAGGRVLSFERRVRFDAKRVVLVTYDNDRLIAK
jgi:ferredoxin